MDSETRDAVNPDALAIDLKALAHEKRIRLVHFLVEPRSLEEIASELGVARQSAHEHLQQLIEVGLVARVERRPDAKPGMAFVVVPHRIFHLYEAVGRLGNLGLLVDEKVQVRHATQADGAPTVAYKDDDLPRLTLVHGMRIGQTAILAGAGPWLIGRDPSALVCVDYDPYASLRHAEIRREPGGFEIADLYSSNGTAIDWKPVERGGVARLQTGAILRVGRSLLSFRHPSGRP